MLTAKAAQVKAAGTELVTLYCQNVFPDMKVTWGTHPNNIGHMAYPGCFRCHDGDHVSKDGKTITQDCANCHNLLAVEEAKPKVLADLGLIVKLSSGGLISQRLQHAGNQAVLISLAKRSRTMWSSALR